MKTRSWEVKIIRELTNDIDLMISNKELNEVISLVVWEEIRPHALNKIKAILIYK